MPKKFPAEFKRDVVRVAMRLLAASSLELAALKRTEYPGRAWMMRTLLVAVVVLQHDGLRLLAASSLELAALKQTEYPGPRLDDADVARRG